MIPNQGIENAKRKSTKGGCQLERNHVDFSAERRRMQFWMFLPHFKLDQMQKPGARLNIMGSGILLLFLVNHPHLLSHLHLFNAWCSQNSLPRSSFLFFPSLLCHEGNRKVIFLAMHENRESIGGFQGLDT